MNSGNVITSDNKGNLIFFLLIKTRLLTNSIFIKKFKKIDKFLNIIIENGIIYISDNIGYIYAFNYLENKILWAKNYKIPFKSNLKIYGKKLITSNQNNDLYIFDKDSGEIIKLIPTEETKIKNDFKIIYQLKWILFFSKHLRFTLCNKFEFSKNRLVFKFKSIFRLKS